MAYDERLAERVRVALSGERSLEEIKMFGGLAFMVDGHMCCGIIGPDLMLRLGPEGARAALARRHVEEMTFTGRSLTGMVIVAAAGLRGQALAKWASEARAFVATLPPKAPKKERARPGAKRPRSS